MRAVLNEVRSKGLLLDADLQCFLNTYASFTWNQIPDLKLQNVVACFLPVAGQKAVGGSHYVLSSVLRWACKLLSVVARQEFSKLLRNDVLYNESRRECQTVGGDVTTRRNRIEK